MPKNNDWNDSYMGMEYDVDSLDLFLEVTKIIEEAKKEALETGQIYLVAYGDNRFNYRLKIIPDTNEEDEEEEDD